MTNKKKKSTAHPMPTISLQPTARSTLPAEWNPNVYGHPEGDGQFYIEVNCVGMDFVLCLNDFDELKALQKSVNEAIAEEEELRK